MKFSHLVPLSALIISISAVSQEITLSQPVLPTVELEKSIDVSPVQLPEAIANDAQSVEEFTKIAESGKQKVTVISRGDDGKLSVTPVDLVKNNKE